jgi:hypothetical protein
MNLKTTPHLSKLLAESERVPEGFVAIGPADHPKKPRTSGMLIRNRRTGVYVLLCGGAIVSVPPKWAAEMAGESAGEADAIQSACIARMEALDLNPNRVAELLDGRVSRAHVCDYLSRRSSMGSHKLQHLLAVLGLRLTVKA